MLPDNILFSQDPAKDLSSFLTSKRYSKVVVLTDENTSKYCLPLLQFALPESNFIRIRSGEEQKTLATCELIWEDMTELELDRHAVLVVIGGGVLGDMGGFCAATYKRGIDFVLVPTTLLAQVDASIGGKLGIDFNTFKNHIGVFRNPALTLLHSGFLETLPLAELRSGYAEVVKHCLISDKAMWDQIKTKPLSQQDWNILAEHSVNFKAAVTTEDPTEKGLRKILNAGHTIGHAVESYLLGSGKKIMHGEAVAIGLIAEGYIAKQRGKLSEEELREITSYIVSVFGQVELTEVEIDAAGFLAMQDKKNKDGKILCVLLDGIGKCTWDEEISREEISSALKYYQSVQM